MQKAHDRGGWPTDEPIDQSDHALADWEHQIGATMRVLFSAGLANVDEMRRGIESLPPDDYESLSYYERWAASMETILTEKGVLSKEEIDEREKSISQRWG
jgi:hypothetical protein